jgi:hypothetical protein
MVSRDLVPMRERIAGPRKTGKSLQIAVDSVPPTGSGRSSSRAKNRAAEAANGQVEMFQIGPIAASLDMDQGRRPTAVNDGHCI